MARIRGMDRPLPVGSQGQFEPMRLTPLDSVLDGHARGGTLGNSNGVRTDTEFGAAWYARS